MQNVDSNVIHFLQCPRRGQELEQAIGLLKADRRMVCGRRQVEINFDTAKVAAATESLHDALAPGPNQITIKFYR